MNEKLKAILAELRSHFEGIYGDRLVKMVNLPQTTVAEYKAIPRADTQLQKQKLPVVLQLSARDSSPALVVVSIRQQKAPKGTPLTSEFL